MSSTLDAARAAYADGYYGRKLEEGLQFQDAVTRALYLRGIVVVGYASKKFQCQFGENMFGAEIKRDGNFRTTGNLYIETAEKSHPDRPTYTASGIHREDNTWLYVIGDEHLLYLFPVKYLRLLEKRYETRQTPTSRGFLMPLAEADRYCIQRLELPKVVAI